MNNPQPSEKKEKANQTAQQRSLAQNRAIHLYLSIVARELENQGQTMRDVVKKMPLVEIPPTTKSLKEIVWKPIQETSLGRKSTTELKTAEVRQIYEIISMFLAKEFEISLPFPSEEETDNYLKSYEQN